MDAKLDLFAPLNDFLVAFLCKFPHNIDERCFKMSLELLNANQTTDEKKSTKLLYCIHANFPNFFESSRLMGYLKDKIRPINFETYDSTFIGNTELFRIETFVDDLTLINKHFNAYKRDADKMKNYFVFVNLFCFKKKVDSR